MTDVTLGGLKGFSDRVAYISLLDYLGSAHRSNLSQPAACSRLLPSQDRTQPTAVEALVITLSH